MTNQPHDEQPQEQPKRHHKPKDRGHGEGSVFMRKGGDRNKPWVAQIPLGRGKKQTVGYYATKQEAVVAKNKALQDIEQLQRVKNSRQTLGEYLEYWLEHVHRLSVRLSTYVQNRALLKLHLIPALGNVPLQKLTARDVQQLYSKLQERLSAGRVKNLHVLLHKALKHAMEDNLVRENVCDRVTLPRMETDERPVLTQAQARLLVQAAKETRLETLLTVVVTTGMRHGELRALRWQDVDLDKKEIHVRYSSGWVPGYGNVQSEPKTKKGRRTIALHPFVVEALRSHRTEQLEQRLKAGAAWQDHDLVFPGRTGNYFNRPTLYKNFHKILAKAGLPRIRLHDLRHSAATILLAMGVNIRVVQEILGHSSISITLGIYGHVLPGMQEEAMQKWDNVLGE
jgi:integrase